MKKLCLGLLIGSILTACSSSKPRKINASAMDNLYISNGVEQFFLAEIPYWANFSTTGQCQRRSNIRYLNFQKLFKSYGLSYPAMIHLQHMFNRKLYAYRTSSSTVEIPLKDESYVFYNVYQQVLGGRFEFIPPKFSEVSLIWIDHLIAKKSDLKKLFQHNSILQGHPILLSFCLNSYELENMAKNLGVDDLGLKYLGADMMSVFNANMDSVFQFSLDIQQFLEGKAITLFAPYKPKSLMGDYDFVSTTEILSDKE